MQNLKSVKIEYHFQEYTVLNFHVEKQRVDVYEPEIVRFSTLSFYFLHYVCKVFTNEPENFRKLMKADYTKFINQIESALFSCSFKDEFSNCLDLKWNEFKTSLCNSF